MYLPILAKRMPNPSERNEDCMNSLRACSTATTEASDPSPSTTGASDSSSSHWYIKDGPHRYMGAVIVAVMLLIVFGVYLYVGKAPRRFWRRIFKRSPLPTSIDPSTPSLGIGEKEKWHDTPSGADSDRHQQTKSPSLEVDYRIAPEQIAWLPDKPKTCMKKHKVRTVELEWSHPVGHTDRRGDRQTRDERRHSKKSSRRSQRKSQNPLTSL